MPGKELNILVVAADNAATKAMLRETSRRIPADILHVESAAEAADACAMRAFDIALVAESLPDGPGAALLENSRIVVPIVLLCERANADALLSAFRAGVADVLTGPFDYYYLVKTVKKMVKHHREVKQAHRRASRLRSLASRLIRDRREVRQRVDLICTDIVPAYQLLAKKVVAATAQRDEDSFELPEFATDGDD